MFSNWKKECAFWNEKVCKALKLVGGDPADFLEPFSFFKKLVLNLGLPNILGWDEEKVEGRGYRNTGQKLQCCPEGSCFKQQNQ